MHIFRRYISPSVGITYRLKDSRKAQQILFTSGQSDTLLVPDASRDLASTNRWTAQGHTPHLQETNPGLIGFNDSFFIPFCYERDTGYYLLPRFPPPTQAVFQAQGNTSMPVIDLHKNIKDGTYKNIYMGHMVNAVDSILERGELAGAADAKDVEFIPPKVAQPYMHAGVPLSGLIDKQRGGDMMLLQAKVTRVIPQNWRMNTRVMPLTQKANVARTTAPLMRTLLRRRRMRR